MTVSMAQAGSESNHTCVILHITEGLLSLISIPLEETAIRAKLVPKMASVIRLDLTVAPYDQTPPYPPPLTLHFPTAHWPPPPLKQPIRNND